MVFDSNGIVLASKSELLAIWTFDPDLSRIMEFCEWLKWCRIVGVRVYGA